MIAIAAVRLGERLVRNEEVSHCGLLSRFRISHAEQVRTFDPLRLGIRTRVSLEVPVRRPLEPLHFGGEICQPTQQPTPARMWVYSVRSVRLLRSIR